jgi:hypothetical protein
MTNKRSKVVQRDIFGDNWSFKLTAEEREDLHCRIKDGEWGGNQNYIAKMQTREKEFGELEATGAELADAYYKAFAYGKGTWQKACQAVVSAAMRAGWKPSPELEAKTKAHRQEVESRKKKEAVQA